MKKSIVIGISTIICGLLLISCAKIGIKAPISIPAAAGPVTSLAFSTDAGQMSGVSLGSLKLGVGETATVYVRGVDDKGKWRELPASAIVNWKADSEVEVAPLTGNVVTVKVLKEIAAASYVTAAITSESGSKIEAMLQVRN